jgi:hypothetical protein
VTDLEYRKQLLIQKIDAHRTVLALEMARLRDVSPLGSALALYRQSARWLQRIDPRLQEWLGRGRKRDLSLWVNLALSLPLLFRLARWLVGRRRRARAAGSD